MIGLASLRCGDPTRTLAIARGGGPLYKNDDLHLWCPLCSCQMSGHPHIENGVDPGCDDDHCPCHEIPTSKENQ